MRAWQPPGPPGCAGLRPIHFRFGAGRAGPPAGAIADLWRAASSDDAAVIRILCPEKVLKALRSFAAGPSTAKLHQAAPNAGVTPTTAIG